MAYKRSLLDDLSLLPWWVNILLAVLVYVLFKFIAPAIEPDAPIFKAIFLMLPGLAEVFSFILCVVALASVIRSWQRGELFKNQTSLADIQNLTWQQFEQYIGEAYKRKGFSIQETGLGGADGGVDLILAKDGKKILVQCKNWKTKKVGVPVVRELFGVVKAQQAAGGLIVTAGSYTKDAQSFAHETGIELIDGKALVKLVNLTNNESPTDSVNIQQSSNTLLCPKCSASMVQRTAKQGVNKGKTFWGCSRFPACKGIRN